MSAAKPLAYAVGSGTRAFSYLLEDHGFLFEAPVAYYATGHSWGLAPGYDAYSYPYLTRPIVPGCLACHASSLQVQSPTLNRYASPAFLEGGVAWASNLCLDLAGHWEKRNREVMRDQLHPSHLDKAQIRALLQEFGDDRVRRHVDDILECNLDLSAPFSTVEDVAAQAEDVDDFGQLQVSSADELKRLFASNFHFGCEADDPTAAWAFDARLNLPLKAMFSSDISHFDVPDGTEVLAEAWELVEHGLITEADFRKFTFSHCVNLHGGMNPDFFKGTIVEGEAAADLLTAAD